MNKVLIAPSILSADFSKLGEEILKVEKAGADWIHVDVMDGAFVPNISIGSCVVKSIREVSDIIFDVHLMIDKPQDYIESFASAGADIITFHIEAVSDSKEIIAKIKEKGLKAGISIKPNTDVTVIKDLLNDLDMVLVMSVEPGFGGQSFMESSLPKLRWLKENFKGYIQVDGGINEQTAKEVIAAGANVLVAGTAIFGKDDYRDAIRRLKGE